MKFVKCMWQGPPHRLLHESHADSIRKLRGHVCGRQLGTNSGDDLPTQGNVNIALVQWKWASWIGQSPWQTVNWREKSEVIWRCVEGDSILEVTIYKWKVIWVHGILCWHYCLWVGVVHFILFVSSDSSVLDNVLFVTRKRQFYNNHQQLRKYLKYVMGIQ
jgi:hypothetical protein